MSNDQWFYSDAQQQQQGPITFAQIQQMAAGGQIQPSTLIWNEGMASWTAASSVPGVYDQPAAPSAGSNPYAAPAFSPQTATTGGSFPIPLVKRSSYALFLTLSLIGFVLYGIASIMMASAMVSAGLKASQEVNAGQPGTVEEMQKQNQAQQEAMLEEMPFEAIGVGMIGMVFLIVAWILSLIALYRAWACLQPGGARTTPGKAVGFQFIPLFNIYWIFVSFYGWAQDWTRIKNSHSNLAQMPNVSPGLFLTAILLPLGILIPILNIVVLIAAPIVYLVAYKQMYNVVNAMAAASNQPR